METAEKESDKRQVLEVEQLIPYRGNLVLSFLLERLHFGILGVVIFVFVALSLVTVLLNALQKTLWLTSQDFYPLWSTQFITHWTSVPFIYPTLAAVAIVIYRQIPTMFKDLIDSGVLVAPSRPVSFFTDLQKRYQSRIVNLTIIISLTVFVIGWIIVESRQQFAEWTHNIHGVVTVAGWYWIIASTAAIYVLLHVGYAIFLTYHAIHTVFREKSGFKIKLKFMHPDRCCGLRPLSKFVLRVGLFLALLGLANGIHIIASFHRLGGIKEVMLQVGPILCAGGYILLAPVAFFLPLIPAHRVMKESKHKFQLDISHEFDRRFGHLSDRIAQGQLDGSEHSQLEVLRGCQQYVDSFPVWPFSVSTVGRFAAMVILPLILTVLGVFLQRLFES